MRFAISFNDEDSKHVIEGSRLIGLIQKVSREEYAMVGEIIRKSSTTTARRKWLFSKNKHLKTVVYQGRGTLCYFLNPGVDVKQKSTIHCASAHVKSDLRRATFHRSGQAIVESYRFFAL